MNSVLTAIFAAGAGGHPWDETTLGQQLIGSGILLVVVFVLVVKFLVPYLHKRRTKIADTFDQLQSDRESAIGAFDDFEKKLSDIEGATDARFQAAVKEGEEARRALVQEAQEQSDRVSIRVKRETDLEARKASQELRTTCVNFSIGATERLLKEKISDDVNSGIVDRYIEQLQEVQRI